MSGRSISQVVGSILLVAIVVLLAVVIGGIALQLTESTQQSPARAAVSVSPAGGSNVLVTVHSLESAETIRVKTSGGVVTFDSVGTYTVDTFGNDITIIGKSGDSSQLLLTYSPDVSASETSDVLVVESDSTVATTDGFDTLKAAQAEADSGDVIRIESGIHTDPNTVNLTVNKSVTLTFEPNTVLSCEKTPVSLKSGQATMGEGSTIPQTRSCDSVTPSYPVPTASDGITFKITKSGNLAVKITTDGNYTLTDGNTTKTFSGAGTYLFNISKSTSAVNVFADDSAGDGDSDTTTSTDTKTDSNSGSGSGSSSGSGSGSGSESSTGTASGEEEVVSQVVVNDTGGIHRSASEKQELTYTKYYVLPESGGDTQLSGENVVTTVNAAVEKASAGNTILILSGTHTAAGTVQPNINKNVRVGFKENVVLSCSETDVDFAIGSGTFIVGSSLPSIQCNSTENTASTSGLLYESCKRILENNPDAKSGYYNITLSDGSTTEVKCDMETDGGGWTRILATDFKDGTTQGWRTDTNSGTVRGSIFRPACSAPLTNSISVNINDYGLNYSEVRFSVDPTPIDSWDSEPIKVFIDTADGSRQIGPTQYAEHDDGPNRYDDGPESYPTADCSAWTSDSDSFRVTETIQEDASLDRLRIYGSISSGSKDEAIGVDEAYIWVR